MKEDWLKDIHNRMTDYEIDAPDNLWEQIQTKMSEAEKKNSQSTASLWTKSLVAAAAIAILLFSIHYYLDKGETPSAIIAIDVQPEKFPNKEDNIILDSDFTVSPFINNKDSLTEEDTNQNTLEKNILAERKSSIQTQKKKQNKTDEDALKTIVISKNIQVVNIKRNNFSSENQLDKILLPTNEDTLTEEIVAVTDKNYSKRMSFGVFTSGGTSSSLNSKSVDNVDIQGIGVDESTWKDSPILGTLTFNHGKETETEIKHRQPIRVGLLFNYGITNRLGIESGITYTNLTSDVREGSENHYFTSQQKLHYVGIPLNLRYKILDLRRFGLYSSLGVLSEKSVSGELVKTYFIDNQSMQIENEKIKINTWQWSANASLGMQYNFSSFFGIYAEPGVSYYFKNNTPMETIYTDKPFNFNFNHYCPR